MGNLNTSKDQIISKTTNFLRNKEEIELSYIFGSFVNKDHYHDIDIAVYLNGEFNQINPLKYPYGYESSLIGELSLLLKENIDVIVMNYAGLLIQQRVVNKGILLFSRDERFRIRYENTIRKQYIDAAHLRNIKRYYLKKALDNARY
jgi:predicted nucleotidyltransferase